jgi:hypothetical protein
MAARRNRSAAKPGKQSRAGVAPVSPQQIATGAVVRDTWDDPADTGRQGTYVRIVSGYRRADPVLAMHRRNPGEITRGHVQAAERLRDDYEIAEGVNTGGRGSGGEVGPTEAMLDARRRFERAKAALGDTLASILLPVVLDGWTVKQWTEARPLRDAAGDLVLRNGKPVPSLSEEKAGGFLIAALGRLRDHYTPLVRNPAEGRIRTAVG